MAGGYIQGKSVTDCLFRSTIFENLRTIAAVPSVQMKDIPESVLPHLVSDDAMDAIQDSEDPDVRISVQRSDQYVQPENEMSDSEDEGDGRRDQTLHLPKKPKIGDGETSPQVLTTNGINILSNKESV